MKAHVQILSGIVRVGENCEHYLDNYDFAVAFSSVDNATAIGMGLVNPWGEAKPVTRAHILAAIKQVKEDTGLDLIYERAKNMTHNTDANTVTDKAEHIANINSAIEAHKAGALESVRIIDLHGDGQVTQEVMGDEILYHLPASTVAVKKAK